MKRFREMPHYAVGDYTQHSHVLDLEFEMLHSSDELINRMVTLATGESFESKNGGSFSIPDYHERLTWIRDLEKDATFRQMLKRFGIEADAEFFQLLLEAAEA